MADAYVELSCPNCENLWDEGAGYMPGPEEPLACPSCTVERPAAAFARRDHDLEVLQRR